MSAADKYLTEYFDLAFKRVTMTPQERFDRLPPATQRHNVMSWLESKGEDRDSYLIDSFGELGQEIFEAVRDRDAILLLDVIEKRLARDYGARSLRELP
jgi:hypothetical protein